jgi:hypothetical protein
MTSKIIRQCWEFQAGMAAGSTFLEGTEENTLILSALSDLALAHKIALLFYHFDSPHFN